ncbi:TRAP transporter substrate-binding protein [Enterovirga aerilata]|uniref:TRAP transporter substrate-binding protein n=1 Tax=Enterovirga aerilata TaxID=2730920 RepID=A0A849ID76_9HYPH|nr:TRAP transporter substrate-binding protein [Enterovirga sp. DB1703]NNM71863.1 TRAP transporter substrate-binding protein [Enterovirga sp. DB1703]
MQRLRDRLRIVAAAAAACLCASLAEARTFRAADNQVESYPTVQALQLMDRLVRERTGSRHRIQVFHSRQLGEEKDTIEQTRAGAIDINRVNVTPLGHLSPMTQVLVLPFLFRSREHLDRVLQGPIGEEILESFRAAGLVGLAFYASGARSVYNEVRPVRTPADLHGLTIRVQASEVMEDLVRALGARPVKLSYGQVLAALQMKLIDGAENNWPSYVSTGHSSVARYVALTEHVMAPEILVMSAKSFDALSPEDQAIFREAARESSRFMQARWDAYEREMRELGAGTSVITEVDRAAFEAATRPVREKHLADPRLQALADRIQAVR